jgi:hypothetical protein
MMQAVTTLVFAGAAATSGVTIWAMVAPQWRRIARLATGRLEQDFAPLAELVEAERRIAVRRWSAASRPVAPWLREAA